MRHEQRRRGTYKFYLHNSDGSGKKIGYMIEKFKQLVYSRI